MKVVLVSCVAKKADIPEGSLLPAKELYVSPLFQKAYAYAESLTPDHIFILSAKHGLLEPDELICKYNESLYSKNSKERLKWSDKGLSGIGYILSFLNSKLNANGSK